jgi:tRNA pseudouridine38-40 synthase
VVPRRAPLARRFAWEVSGEVDLAAMRGAAELLRGRHDFGAFGRSPQPGGGTVRTVHEISVRRVTAVCGGESFPVVIMEVTADAFLYGMMRSIAGALVAVATGRLSQAAARRGARASVQPPGAGHGGPGPRPAPMGRHLSIPAGGDQ